jgi:hypothetical protein
MKMNAIQEVKDEAIRKVAQTLRSSGLASSETEAVRMAMAMSKTSQRVTQNFDQKKTGATMGNHFSNEAHTEPQAEVHVKGGLSFAYSNNEHSQPSQHQNHSFAFSADNQPVVQNAPEHVIVRNVQTPFPVQEKPSKTEEKEEFIFGDIQDDKTAQEKDPFNVQNDFEEVVSQEVISTKPKPSVAQPQVHRAFGEVSSSSSMNHVNIPSTHAQASQAPVHERESAPAPVQGVSSSPMTAQSSAQMAFASILGAAQKTQTHQQEAKPAVHPSPVQASSEKAPAAQPPAPHHIETQPAHAASPINQAPRPVTAADPRKTMMQEANVDLSKMFNVHK